MQRLGSYWRWRDYLRPAMPRAAQADPSMQWAQANGRFSRN